MLASLARNAKRDDTRMYTGKRFRFQWRQHARHDDVINNSDHGDGDGNGHEKDNDNGLALLCDPLTVSDLFALLTLGVLLLHVFVCFVLGKLACDRGNWLYLYLFSVGSEWTKGTGWRDSAWFSV